MVQRDN